MNDCAFYLKVVRGLMSDVLNFRPERVLRPPPVKQLSMTHSIYFCQHIAIESTVWHELKTMGNTGRRIFSVVRNKQQLRFTFANQHINKTADKLAIERIKPL